MTFFTRCFRRGALLFLLAVLLLPSPAQAVRIKDIASFGGVRDKRPHGLRACGGAWRYG